MPYYSNKHHPVLHISKSNRIGLSLKYSLIILCSILTLIKPTIAQVNIDSLEQLLNNASPNEKTDLFIALSKAHWFSLPSKGMAYSKNAVKLAEEQNEPAKKAKALLYGGVNAWKLGNYELAIDYYQKSLVISEQIQNKKLCAFNLNNLGMINYHLENYDKALSYYTKSSEILKELDEPIEYAKIVNNIGELNMILTQYDEALTNHLSILSIIENSDEKYFLRTILSNIGNVYDKKGDNTTALMYYNKALVVCNQIDDEVGKTDVFNDLGKVYLKRKEYSKAKESLFKALKYAQKTETKENIKESYKNLSTYYSEIKSYQKALDYYALYKEVSDIIINSRKMDKIVEMQTRYDSEAKEKENILLRKSNEVNQLIIEKQKYLRNFFIVLLVLALLFITLLYSQFSHIKRNNHLLRAKNKQITEQKDELSLALDKLKEANHELELQKENLNELNATKDKFFSIIAHDLKSPFTGRIGFSQLLVDNFEELDNTTQKLYIDQVHQCIENSYSLLENLLTWSRAQMGRISFEQEELNLNDLVSENIKLSNQTAAEKSIKITSSVSPDLMIFADKEMLSTIIRNLISNAIKFTPKNGKVEVKAFEDWREPNFIKIFVKDSGIGISSEIQSKLFNISETYSTKGTENETGTGLGLILCKEFIEKHGGKIWVNSQTEKGSEFGFTMPSSSE